MTDALLPGGWSDRELEPTAPGMCVCGHSEDEHYDFSLRACACYGCDCGKYLAKLEDE